MSVWPPTCWSWRCRHVAASLVAAGFLVGAVFAQAPGSSFEIVSLRRSEYRCPAFSLDAACPPLRPTWTMLPGGRLELTDHLAINLIRVAYGVERLGPKYITGGPGWLRDDRYDLIALVGTGEAAGAPVAPGVDAVARARLRALLQDRFKLRTSIVKKKMDVLLLTRVKAAVPLTLTRSAPECELFGSVAMPGVEWITPPCAVLTRRGGFDTRGMTMAALTAVLTPTLGVPVIDETGEPGRFDFSLNWPVSREATGTYALKAINESLRNLGVEVRETSRPFDTVVIESAERPEEDR